MNFEAKETRRMRQAVIALYRVRGIVFYATAVIFVVSSTMSTWSVGSVSAGVERSLALLVLGLAAVCGLLVFVGRLALLPHPAVTVQSPVRGRWIGLNSPVNKVPSHGVRMYGQAYAIDLAAEPRDAVRPAFGSGPGMRQVTDYPAFGEPVYAMIDGTVVQARDAKRDHRARSGWMSLFYLMAEGIVREIGGPQFIVGNHVIIRGADGTFALVAHLQQGSATVRRGDSVTAGQQIGSCGNSGNSSEPHVHAQLMDRQSLWTAQGINMQFADIDLPPIPAPGASGEEELAERERVNGLPANGQHILVQSEL